MALISYRSRLTKVLAVAIRGKKGSKGGECKVRLPGVDTGRQLQVDMLFQIGGGRGWGGIREFVNETDGPAFLERELMGLGVDRYL